MTINALIMTLPIVTIVVRKTAAMTNAAPNGMTMTMDARQSVHHAHNVEDDNDDWISGLHNPRVWTPSESEKI